MKAEFFRRMNEIAERYGYPWSIEKDGKIHLSPGLERQRTMAKKQTRKQTRKQTGPEAGPPEDTIHLHLTVPDGLDIRVPRANAINLLAQLQRVVGVFMPQTLMERKTRT